MLIVVASENTIKTGATTRAAEDIGLVAEIGSEEAESGVPKQPYLDSVILRGAVQRAADVLRKRPDANYVVGIENGIAPDGRKTGYIDLAYVVVMDRAGRILRTEKSEEVPVPSELVERSRKSGWTVTAGQLEAERSGCDPADPHRIWSDGTTDRFTTLTATVRLVLSVIKTASNKKES